jgi:hypothetical protein
MVKIKIGWGTHVKFHHQDSSLIKFQSKVANPVVYLLSVVKSAKEYAANERNINGISSDKFLAFFKLIRIDSITRP